MPYIKQEQRDPLDPFIEDLVRVSGASAGELNYIITRLIWITSSFDPCYTTYNDMLGVLEAVKQEFYRRVVAPYEDRKREENGDVYV